MKRLFSKSTKAPSPVPASAPALIQAPKLQPAYVVPPVPHPCAYDHISLLATPDGLLLRPYLSPSSYVCITWSKHPSIKESDGDGDYNWDDSVIVYGIVGILDLYSTSYLLVITARDNAGNLFEPTHTVYTVKGITAIPLVHDRAQTTLNTLSSRNFRPSLLPSSTIDTLALSESSDSSPSTPRVQFSESEHIKILTPPAEQSEFPLTTPLTIPDPQSDTASEISTPDTSPATPVTKAIANRLSFWSRLSKRQSSLFSASSSASVTSSAPSDVSDPLLPPSASLKETQSHLETIIDESQAEPKEVITTIINETAPPPSTTEEKHSELEDKVLRECVREFVKGGMYFAYTFDITRSLQHKQELIAKAKRQNELLDDLLPPKDKNRKSKDKDKLNSPTRKTQDKEPHTHSAGYIRDGDKVDPLAEPNPTLPLWRRVDKQFWWNEWLSKPLIDAGLHAYILPLMQGYYQFAKITLPPDELTHPTALTIDYIMVSRRSKERAGLRYQRRGIDDEACVANFVESEMVMGVERGESEGKSIFGYVQIRGSIPLYWTQTSYGLKPPPILSTSRTHAQNLDAMKRHLEKLKNKYVSAPGQEPHSPKDKDKDGGSEITIINLAEQSKTSKEAEVAGGFGKGVNELVQKGLTGVGYHDYDFHVETRGMKYENISKLVDRMEKTFDSQGFLWILNDEVMSQQKGVFRVNCIDCLDRTNVVQSAFARHVLNKQLGAVALLNPSAEGKTETDVVFNDVWANNGDAISRAYAGTSALKGDFTRTGKRDLSGLLNDGVNSLARMYTSTFSDWFSQAVIDYTLGYRTISVFSEFLNKLQSSDPGDLIRLGKIRAEAIGDSVSRCLSEGERLLKGWTLFAPEELNVRVGEKFEEKVLLLSATALYIISYDYTLEKVKRYTRVPLGDVLGISKGAYILSPLEEASRDPIQNAGFVISWLNNNQVTRVTNYSMRNRVETKRAVANPNVNGNVITTTASQLKRLSVTLGSKRGGNVASQVKVVGEAEEKEENDVSFAAFKILPIDPARVRRTSSVGGGENFGDVADELSTARNCKEAVEMVVESIRKACEDVGVAEADFMKNEDVVGLAEAQRMTSMYAKMEYGVKRLLWLGG